MKKMITLTASSMFVLAGINNTWGFDVAVTLGAGAEHTDNSGKSASDQRSDLQSRAGIGLQMGHKTRSVNLDVDYDATYLDFDRDTQEDQSTVAGSAVLVYEQIDNALIWNLSNTRRNVIRDKALNDLQDNREDRSITSISPSFTYRPGSADSIVASISYSDISYEDSEQQNSDRQGASLSWLRKVSPVDTLGVRLNYQDVEFERETSNYEYYQSTISYQAQLSRINYSIAVGYNESKTEADDVGGGYLDFSAGYASGGSSWRLRLLNELSDTSRDDNNESFSGFENFATVDGEVDVFERSSVELSYSNDRLCSLCVVNVALAFDEEEYETLNNNNNEASLQLSFSYQLTRVSSIVASAAYRDFSFEGDNLRNDYELGTLGVSYQHEIFRGLNLNVFVNYEEKDTDQLVQEYEELRGGFGLSYRFD